MKIECTVEELKELIKKEPPVVARPTDGMSIAERVKFLEEHHNSQSTNHDMKSDIVSS